jgi:hypothetical protein
MPRIVPFSLRMGETLPVRSSPANRGTGAARRWQAAQS